jgi:16S rRNA (cytosine967-C5)-methyltransferase
VTPGRQAAREVLAAVGRGRRLDLAFATVAAALPDRERRFAQELSYGVVRLRGRLDHLVALRLDRPLATLDEPVRDVLRLGAYQLLYMEGVPRYAAVSQAVDQIRSAGVGSAAGLVNAVLRAVAAEGDGPELFPDFATDPAGFLSTWGSHPRWLIDRWLARWPAAEVRDLVEFDNLVPPLTFVPLATGPEGVSRAVAAIAALGGRAWLLGRGSETLQVEGVGPEALLKAVPGLIQDPGAGLVCRYADARPGQIVADLCAAPGGKALYLARVAAYVVATDPSSARLRMLQDNVARTGLPVGVVRARAEAPPLRAVDLVLVDAPCTGTGTLRRHPDARWRLGPDDPDVLARVQARLLRGAASVVPSGGFLVYSTCTLEPEENQGVVEAFLEAHPDFERVAPAVAALDDVDETGDLTLLPQRSGFDGAFAARLRRR